MMYRCRSHGSSYSCSGWCTQWRRWLGVFSASQDERLRGLGRQRLGAEAEQLRCSRALGDQIGVARAVGTAVVAPAPLTLNVKVYARRLVRGRR